MAVIKHPNEGTDVNVQHHMELAGQGSEFPPVTVGSHPIRFHSAARTVGNNPEYFISTGDCTC